MLDALAEYGQPPSEDTAEYVLLYQGMAEGCLGQLDAARRDLGSARGVGLGEPGPQDLTCNAQKTLAAGFEAYRDETISNTARPSKVAGLGSPPQPAGEVRRTRVPVANS